MMCQTSSYIPLTERWTHILRAVYHFFFLCNYSVHRLIVNFRLNVVYRLTVQGSVASAKHSGVKTHSLSILRNQSPLTVTLRSGTKTQVAVQIRSVNFRKPWDRLFKIWGSGEWKLAVQLAKEGFAQTLREDMQGVKMYVT